MYTEVAVGIGDWGLGGNPETDGHTGLELVEGATGLWQVRYSKEKR